jgi:hypothetical protein
MGISPTVRVKLVGLMLAAAAAIGLAGCDRSTPAAAPTPAAPTSIASPPPSGPPPAATGASDYCALATKILTESGLMVNGRIISAREETLDNLKAVVNLSLAAKDQLLAGLPANVRSALLVELQYFQALKDHDFSSSTPVPAGFDGALKTVNGYGAATCGFTFDS